MTDINELAKKLTTEGPYKLENCPKRIRILLGGDYIVDTTEAVYVWEHPYYPQYYVPRSAVKRCLKHTKTNTPRLDGCDICTFIPQPGSATDANAVENSIEFTAGPLKDLVRFDFQKMDAWFEEDEQIFVHPKDPYKRIDIRRSSRHIRVEVHGVVIAETSSPTLLFETGLRTRYYLPPTCVNQTMLTRSETVTSCPYKGDASYYNIFIDGSNVDFEVEDAIWWYKHPTQESLPIAGLFCFYNEKVDIWVDGVKEPK